MGQYYKIVNITKKQYLHPHAFGDGLKLLEFGASGSGTMLGLAVLLADGNDRGGGDLHTGPTGDPLGLVVLKVLGCDEYIKKALIEGIAYHPEALKALGWTADPPPAKTRRKKGGK